MTKRPEQADHEVAVEIAPPSQSLVSVRGLKKKYAKNLGRTLFYGLEDIFREFVPLSPARREGLREDEFLAVDDVSFELGRGESLAIIGDNGSGKSSLLKMLCGLIKPDAGEIRIRGHVAALVELGSGFDPILSGRENIYINASILGMGREQVDEIMPRIVEFSGLADFMETPVKYYSSGMKSRLGYAVAAHLSPDIFVVDEVLAVGDSDFQQKCVRNMIKYVEGGGALIFVSHASALVQNVCQRGLVMAKGKIIYTGTSGKALDHYFSLFKKDKNPKREESKTALQETPDFSGVTLESVSIVPLSGSHGKKEIYFGDSVKVSMQCHCSATLEVVAHFSIWTRDSWVCITGGALFHPQLLEPGDHLLECHIAQLSLVPGLYHLRCILRDPGNTITLAQIGWEGSPFPFTVHGEDDQETTISQMLKQLIKVDYEWQPLKKLGEEILTDQWQSALSCSSVNCDKMHEQ